VRTSISPNNVRPNRYKDFVTYLSMFSVYFDKFINFIIKIKSFILFYFSWIAIHYICSQLYVYYCVPYNWYGIFASPFLSLAPHCNAFRWIIYEAGNILHGMWMAIGSWTVANLLTQK